MIDDLSHHYSVQAPRSGMSTTCRTRSHQEKITSITKTPLNIDTTRRHFSRMATARSPTVRPCFIVHNLNMSERGGFKFNKFEYVLSMTDSLYRGVGRGPLQFEGDNMTESIHFPQLRWRAVNRGATATAWPRKDFVSLLS